MAVQRAGEAKVVQILVAHNSKHGQQQKEEDREGYREKSVLIRRQISSVCSVNDC